MELYDQRQVKKYAARIRRWVIGTILLAIAAFAVCIGCCSRVTTLTAASLERTAILVSTVGGWLVIFALTMRIDPDRYALQHEQNVLSGERITHTGVITVEPQVLQIPNSITICKVVMDDGLEKKRFSIRSDKVKLLKKFEGKELTFHTVKGYIAGWEEQE